jgi:PTH1 family peptidyl-tRNA hydrolase
MDKENISLENIFVITDDLNLSFFGTIRIKPKGSDGGQRIKNINLILNTNQYTRFRFGISDEFKKRKQIDYVLEIGMTLKNSTSRTIKDLKS